MSQGPHQILSFLDSPSRLMIQTKINVMIFIGCSLIFNVVKASVFLCSIIKTRWKMNSVSLCHKYDLTDNFSGKIFS
jgi:hypothetical protein